MARGHVILAALLALGGAIGWAAWRTAVDGHEDGRERRLTDPEWLNEFSRLEAVPFGEAAAMAFVQRSDVAQVRRVLATWDVPGDTASGRRAGVLLAAAIEVEKSGVSVGAVSFACRLIVHPVAGLRWRARVALLDAGKEAEPPLREAIESSVSDRRMAAMRVVDDIRGPLGGLIETVLRVFDRDVPQEEHDAAYGASFSILAGDSGTAARVCECLPRLGPEGMSQALYLLWIAYREGNADAEKCVVTALLGGDKQLQMRVLHALALAPAGRTDWSEVVGQVAKGDQDPEVRRLAEQIGRHHR